MSQQNSDVDILRRAIEDDDYLDDLNVQIREIISLIDGGHGDLTIEKRLRKSAIAKVRFLIEVARSRIRTRGKFSKSELLWLDQYSARYSTPEIIGNYRAERIQEHEIFDIGSGGGMQAIFFSTTNRVRGIEKDQKRFLESVLNARAYDAKGVEFVNDEWPPVSSNKSEIRDALVYSDPLREASAEQRKMSDLIPSPVELVNQLSDSTRKFVFDIPPQMQRGEIPKDAETEYISINGELNRLTLYLGPMKKSETSAVLLPRGIKMAGTRENMRFESASKPEEFICVVDPAVTYAGLVNNLKVGWDLKLLNEDRRRVLMTASDYPGASFPGVAYEVLALTDLNGVERTLRAVRARRVFPRFTIEPEKYYQMKNKLENVSTGERDIYIFRVDNTFALCEMH